MSLPLVRLSQLESVAKLSAQSEGKRMIIHWVSRFCHGSVPNLTVEIKINWDELDDFYGEACELAGDFFFEVESDEGTSSRSNPFNFVDHRMFCFMFRMFSSTSQ
jgi:hypothetical protein